MLAALKKQLIDGNCFTGIELVEQNTELFFFCTQLSRKKNALQLVKTFKASRYEEVRKEIRKHHPVYVVINTAQVITKWIDKRTDNELATVNKAFPNINTDLFYYEISEITSGVIVSVCRKETVTQLLKAFSDAHISIIGFSLGYNQLHQFEQYLDKTTIRFATALWNSIQCDFSAVTLEEDVTAYHINGMEVKNQFLMSFGAALTHYLKASLPNTNFKTSLQDLRNKALHERFFNVFSKTFALGILTVLLLNFLVFHYYFQKVATLQQHTQVNTHNKEQLLVLSASVDNKEKKVTDIISTSSSRSSMYIDQIAYLMPHTLLLTEIAYQPVLKKIEENKAILLDKNSLYISGLAKESEDFSAWIEQIEQLPWVEKLDVADYGYENASTSFFKIALDIRDAY